MKRLLLSAVSNFIALIAADYFLEGISFNIVHVANGPVSGSTLLTVALAALILTFLNTFVRPLVKLIFGPVIFLTLGLFTFAINAAMLYILDVLLDPLTIQGTDTLIIATIIVGAVNIVLGLFNKPKED